MTINERIQALIDALKMNSRAFSQHIGLDPAVLHNIVSEKGRRSKPSFDVLEKILLSFDNINPDYLMTGKGSIFKDFNTFDSKNEMYIKPESKGGNLISNYGGNLKGNLKEKTKQKVTQAVKTDFSEGVIHYPRDQDDLDMNKHLVGEGSGSYGSIEMKLYLEYSKAQDALIRHLLEKLSELEERVGLIEKVKK